MLPVRSARGINSAGETMLQFRVLPAQQRFSLTHMATADIQFGLVMQLQLAFAGGTAQIPDQLDVPLMGEVAVLLVHLQITRQGSGIAAGNWWPG